jgi:hypothetical protein
MTDITQTSKRPDAAQAASANAVPGMSDDEIRTINIQLRATLARAAIQAYLLLNGGAAVALLAFLGNLATAPENTRLVADLGMLKFALMIFNSGTALAATSYWAGYQVYTDIIKDPNSRRAASLRQLAVALNLIALFLFVAGIVVCAQAITAR